MTPTTALARILLVQSVVALGCSGSDGEAGSGVSYARDVEPLFSTDPWNGPSFGGRCASCHHRNTVTGLDLTRPADPVVGLVGVKSKWKGSAGVLRVAPGDVARSFLVDKIARTDLARETEGWSMPSQIPRLTSTEVESVRQWIRDGARVDVLYLSAVAPIFGDAKSDETAGRCSVCHYPGSPTHLDLTNPFDPEFGLVDVPTEWGAEGGVRVVPGDPDRSFLIDKIERADLDPLTDGQPMPLHAPPLSADEVEIVRVWIEGGARLD